MFQDKGQEKNWKKNPNKTEINKLTDKEFKAIVVRMPTELRKRIDNLSENFNKNLENIKKKQSELKNTISEKKKIHQIDSSRLGDKQESISDLEDTMK